MPFSSTRPKEAETEWSVRIGAGAAGAVGRGADFASAAGVGTALGLGIEAGFGAAEVSAASSVAAAWGVVAVSWAGWVEIGSASSAASSVAAAWGVVAVSSGGLGGSSALPPRRPPRSRPPGGWSRCPRRAGWCSALPPRRPPRSRPPGGWSRCPGRAGWRSALPLGGLLGRGRLGGGRGVLGGLGGARLCLRLGGLLGRGRLGGGRGVLGGLGGDRLCLLGGLRCCDSVWLGRLRLVRIAHAFFSVTLTLRMLIGLTGIPPLGSGVTRPPAAIFSTMSSPLVTFPKIV